MNRNMAMYFKYLTLAECVGSKVWSLNSEQVIRANQRQGPIAAELFALGSSLMTGNQIVTLVPLPKSL